MSQSSGNTGSLDCQVNTHEALLQVHQDWLQRVIRARVCEVNLTDDVLQEVALAVERASYVPETDEELKPWLCKIAIRQCALVLRKASRQNALAERYGNQQAHQSNEPSDPIFWLIQREETSHVQQAFSQIDEQSKQVLHWKYVENQTYKMIAERLQVTIDAAEYRVLKAKKELRLLLTDLGMA